MSFASTLATALTLTPGQLLQRYEPVVVLHPEERFAPVAVDAFLADARLEATAAGPRYALPDCTADVGVPSIDCYAAIESVRRPKNVVYGAVRAQRNRIALQYWYWYSYNFWSGEHPATDHVWQAHEGDWETVVVLLTRAGRPLLAGYSQHSCGKRRAWSRVPRAGRTHPVVHVALGSHANEFRVGELDMDLRPQCYDPAGAGILRAALPRVLDRTGDGRRVATRLVRVTSSSPTWMRFPGAWGEANVFHAGGRNFFSGLGPRGPAFHDVWRDPLGTLARWPVG
ncbi:MAG TPA: hypothetical protein VE444_06470 [Gaiellaceae bacterium]|nr:hypothetical protein [Gaiellaceae bacterium]